jgi:hypothetical protein
VPSLPPLAFSGNSKKHRFLFIFKHQQQLSEELPFPPLSEVLHLQLRALAQFSILPKLVSQLPKLKVRVAVRAAVVLELEVVFLGVNFQIAACLVWV